MNSSQEATTQLIWVFNLFLVNHFACVYDGQPRSSNLEKSEVFLRKNYHLVFIQMALVLRSVSSNGLVVSTRTTFFFMFMIDTTHVQTHMGRNLDYIPNNCFELSRYPKSWNMILNGYCSNVHTGSKSSELYYRRATSKT